MNLLSRVLEHANADEMRHIEVPEWDVTIYYTPITLKDGAAAAFGTEKIDDVSERSGRINAKLLCLKALDKDGSRLFRVVDATDIYEKADGAVVMRIVMAMQGSKPPELIEKN